MIRLKKGVEIPSKNIFYKGENLIVYRAKEAEDNTKEVVIIGDGCSFSLDSQNRVTYADPGLQLKTPKELSHIKKEILMTYFPFECAGLRQSGEEIAEFMNERIFNTYYHADFSGLQWHQFYNIICLLQKPESLGGLGCYYLKKRKHQNGDGIVTRESQRLTEVKAIEYFLLNKSHADFWDIIYSYLL